MAVIEGLSADERAAHAKGYGVMFDDYVDIDAPIWISAMQYAQLVAWCDPYMERRHEVQGAVAFRFDESHLGFDCVRIEHVYVMGGNSQSFRTTCLLDGEDMIRQMRFHYPERTQFMSHEVGWWHLHPGYYASLSVGDVEECRQTLRDCGTKVLHLLMYGHPGGSYQLSGYLIGLEDVNRLPVRIEEI